MATASRATGCYKCGQTGHWSRDCPSQAGGGGRDGHPIADQFENEGNPLHAGSSRDNEFTTKAPSQIDGQRKQKRPRLTPEQLISESGIRYILNTFPKQVLIKGKGHEVGDLRRLLEAYMRWHQQVFPSLTFPEFIAKVEHVGATKLVRAGLREMRDELDKATAEREASSVERKGDDDEGNDDQNQGDNADDDDIFNDHNNVEHDSPEPNGEVPPPRTDEVEQTEPTYRPAPSSLTDEQKARMEANRKLALERAQARAAAIRATPAVQQKAPSAASESGILGMCAAAAGLYPSRPLSVSIRAGVQRSNMDAEQEAPTHAGADLDGCTGDPSAALRANTSPRQSDVSMKAAPEKVAVPKLHLWPSKGKVPSLFQHKVAAKDNLKETSKDTKAQTSSDPGSGTGGEEVQTATPLAAESIQVETTADVVDPIPGLKRRRLQKKQLNAGMDVELENVTPVVQRNAQRQRRQVLLCDDDDE